jgi:hypothetical protein
MGSSQLRCPACYGHATHGDGGIGWFGFDATGQVVALLLPSWILDLEICQPWDRQDWRIRRLA